MPFFGTYQSTDNLKPLKKQVLFKCGAYPAIQISSLKVPMTPRSYRLIVETFSGKITTYETLQSTNNSKLLKKQDIL